MKVKDLKELLNGVDESMEVLILDNNYASLDIDYDNIGGATFSGACDEEGTLMPDGNDEKYNVDCFIIQLK